MYQSILTTTLFTSSAEAIPILLIRPMIPFFHAADVLTISIPVIEKCMTHLTLTMLVAEFVKICSFINVGPGRK